VLKKNKKKIKKKLNASISGSISVYAASDAQGQYLKKRENTGNKIFIRRN
jgi:hypothetical protein